MGMRTSEVFINSVVVAAARKGGEYRVRVKGHICGAGGAQGFVRERERGGGLQQRAGDDCV
jgi:hypothetical protein